MMDIGRLPELIGRLAAQGVGTTVRPIKKGMLRGGILSDDRYQEDGWEVGYITGMGGDEFAVRPTLAEAVEEAIRIDGEADG